MSADQKPAISPEKAAKLMLTPVRKPAQGAIRADLGDQFWIHGPKGELPRGNAAMASKSYLYMVGIAMAKTCFLSWSL